MLLWEIVTYCDQPYDELDANEIIAKIEMKSLSLPRFVLSLRELLCMKAALV